jgi:surface antigen
MKKSILSMVLVSALALTACENTLGSMGTKQTVGTGGGAILGGLAGSQIGGGSGRLWATGAGVLLGALVGSEIGKSLDNADRAYAQQANQRALSSPIGQQISWNNPNSGNYGYVTPINDGRDANGNYCREYTQTIYVGGRQETGKGTACQQSDGTWKIVN